MESAYGCMLYDEYFTKLKFLFSSLIQANIAFSLNFSLNRLKEK